MQRLGDILNTRTENLQGRNSQPSLKGAIRFENVRFRYKPEAPAVLNNISFDIEPEKLLALSDVQDQEKSTLTKLIQRLYLPELAVSGSMEPTVALADPSWLRRQIGVVVLRKTYFLVDQFVKYCMALADPGISLESVINAAKLAGVMILSVKCLRVMTTRIGEHGVGCQEASVSVLLLHAR